MTEPSIPSDEPVQRQAGGGLAAAVAPEGVAAVLAIALVAGLLTVRLAGLSGIGLAPTPGPSDGASPRPTIAGPVVDRVAINTALGVNQRLLDFGRSLQAELDKPPVNAGNVRATFSQDMSPQLFAGAPAAARLQDAPATALVGADLNVVYGQLRTLIDEANDFRLSNETAWRTSASAVVEALKALPSIDLRLETLRAGLPDPNAPVAPSVPPPSAVATDSPPPSEPPVTTAPSVPPPTAPPTAGSTVPPSLVPSPTSSPPLAESNQLQNPGFETGPDPWRLVVANPSVKAAFVLDTASPHSGTTSARIDVIASDGIPQSISLQQAGVTLEQGAKYRVSIALRAAADRQVRIRVTSSTPPAQTYGGSGPLLVGSAWTVQTFEFDTAVGGGGRLFSIELGQAGGSVWIDDVSIARVSPFAP
ncbi:MAG: carbohydrate binding domain-containing protein [Candidatus Limnocylindrales bacterium]